MTAAGEFFNLQLGTKTMFFYRNLNRHETENFAPSETSFVPRQDVLNVALSALDSRAQCSKPYGR